MSYQQLKATNLGVVGKGYYCLVYARNIFNVAAKYGTAALAHANAVYKHTDALPTDVSVPVWFSWKVDGHVAVNVPGQGVYSTTSATTGHRVFPSIQAVAEYIGGTYLGWSEDIDGVRIAQPIANPTPSPVQPHGLPSIGSAIQLIPTQVRTTYRPGTATVAGSINVTNNAYVYTVRGYDAKFPGRILINSASAGGNGTALALYYTSGALISGWKVV